MIELSISIKWFVSRSGENEVEADRPHRERSMAQLHSRELQSTDRQKQTCNGSTSRLDKREQN